MGARADTSAAISPDGAADAAALVLATNADGYIQAWLVAGPFPYGKLPASHPPELATPAFDRDFLRETTGVSEPATRAAFGPASPWRPFVASSATVDLLDAVVAPFPPGLAPPAKKAPKAATTYAVVYAYAEIISPSDQDGFLRLGSDDGARVWVGGAEVTSLGDATSHAHHADRLSALLHLRAGATPVLVKIDQRKGAWRFSLRLCDADDRPLDGVTIRLPHDGALGDATSGPDRATEAVAAAAVRATRVRFAPTATRDGFDVAVTVEAPPVRHGPTRLVTAVALPGDSPPAVLVPLHPAPPTRLHIAGKGGAARVTVRVFPDLLPDVPESREALVLPFDTKRHALLADVEGYLAGLRVERAELFAPRPPPRAGVWAEAGADGATGAPLPAPGSGDPRGALDATGVATLEWFASDLRALLEAGDRDVAFLGRRVAELRRLFVAARAGRDPLAGRTGPMFVAYRSRLDGTVQAFALHVPKGYTPKKRWRLFVGLHGLGGKPGRYLRYMMGVPLRPDETNEAAERAFPHAPPLPDADVFLATPYGRGDVAFRGPGEDDVFSVIDTLVERFTIDRDQIHLTGASMGGIGAFELAVHRPDVFASAVPLCGAADVRMYASVGDRPVRDFEASVLAATAAVEWAANLRHLRLWCVHGAKDSTNPATRSRVLIDRMAALGYRNFAYDEPALGHNVWDYTYADGALWKKSTSKRDPFPAHVTFTSGDLRWRSAYWVRIDEAADKSRFATVDAERDDARARLSVTATNLAAFSLLLPPAVARADGHLQIIVNGTVAFDGTIASLGTPPGRTPVLSFRAGSGGPFTRIESPVPSPPAGPLGVMSAEPRLYVYATGDPVMRALTRALAERLASPGGIEDTHMPVKPDWAVTADELARLDVVAVGTPETNWVLAAAARSPRGLPVRFEPGAIVVAGKRHAGRDVGVAFATPSPFNPARALVVYGAVGPAGIGLARHLPRYLPDFVVWDRRLAAATGGAVLGEREVLSAGFFRAP